MSNRSWGIIACIIGCFFGTVIGFIVYAKYWWLGIFVGLLISGLMSYLVSDIKGVISAIPRAWQKARAWKKERTKLFWLRYLIYLFFFTNILATMSFLVFLVRDKSHPIQAWYGMVVVLSVLCLYVGYFFASMEGPNTIIKDKKIAWEVLLYINPVSWFIVWPIVGIFIFFVKIVPLALNFIKGIPKTIKMFLRFLWNLYVMIHTRQRWLVLVDSMLATAIGMTIGMCNDYNLLACGLISSTLGAVFFVFNREIVARKWLRNLIPETASIFVNEN